MRKKISYFDKYGDVFIDYIPKKVYEELDEDVIKDINRFRSYSRYIKSQEEGIRRLEKKMEPLKRELEKRKQKLKGHKTQQKFYFDKIGYLKKRYVPVMSVYEKDESSKSFKLRSQNKSFDHMKKTYRGEKLKKRSTLYCHIKIPKSRVTELYLEDEDKFVKELEYHQTNIYLGSYDKVKELVGDILGEDLSGVKKNTLYRKTQSILIQYIQGHTKDGFEDFTRNSHPFQGKIIPWCKENIKG